MVGSDHGSFPVQEKRHKQLFAFSEVKHLKQGCESLCGAELSGQVGSVAGSFFGRDASVHHLQKEMIREVQCCSS